MGLIVKVEKHAVFRGYVFIIEVVEASAMHEVSDVIIDGKSLKEEAGRKTIIYLEAVEVRIIDEKTALITTRRAD